MSNKKSGSKAQADAVEPLGDSMDEHGMAPLEHLALKQHAATASLSEQAHVRLDNFIIGTRTQLDELEKAAGHDRNELGVSNRLGKMLRNVIDSVPKIMLLLEDVIGRRVFCDALDELQPKEKEVENE